MQKSQSSDSLNLRSGDNQGDNKGSTPPNILSLEKIVSTPNCDTSTSPASRGGQFFANQQQRAQDLGVEIMGFNSEINAGPALSTSSKFKFTSPEDIAWLEQPLSDKGPSNTGLEQATSSSPTDKPSTDQDLIIGMKMAEIQLEFTQGRISKDVLEDKKALLNKSVEYLHHYNRGADLVPKNSLFDDLIINDSIEFLLACQKHNKLIKTMKKLMKIEGADVEFPIADDKIKEVSRASLFSETRKRAPGLASVAYEVMRPQIPGLRAWPSNQNTYMDILFYNNAFLQPATKSVEQKNEQLKDQIRELKENYPLVQY